MSEQLYEQTVPFFGQSLLVCKPKRMEGSGNSALTQECLVHAFSPEHGSSWEFSFTECATEIPSTTRTRHQQASFLLKHFKNRDKILPTPQTSTRSAIMDGICVK